MLNERQLRAIRPVDGKPVEIADVNGLRVRVVMAHGNVVRRFEVRKQVRGKRMRAPLGTYPAVKLAEARELARAQIARWKHGHVAKPGTLSTLVESFVRHLERKGRTENYIREMVRQLKLDVLPEIGHLLPDEVRRVHIRPILERVHDRGSPIMANRVRATISSMLSWCAEMDYCESNVAQHIKPLAPEKPRQYVMPVKVLRKLYRLWEDEDSVPSRLMQALLLTGQRSREVADMTWQELENPPYDGEWWTLPAERTKKKRAHYVAVSTEFRRVLEAVRPYSEGRCSWVFPSWKLDCTRPLQAWNNNVVKWRAEVGTHWNTHDLRSAFATALQREFETNDVVVARMLNQVPQGVTLRHYALYGFEREARKMWNAWGDWLGQPGGMPL